jgi:carbamoyltransferase
MDNVVGFGGSIHDYSTCLISADGAFLAVADERLSRVRYALNDPDPCRASLGYCLAAAGLDATDIRLFAANDMLTALGPWKAELPLLWTNHHRSHAISALFTSPFETSAILVADGAGSVVGWPEDGDSHQRETTTYALGTGNEITVLSRVVGHKRGPASSNDVTALMSNSLGDFYRAITETIGFGFLQAGKTMALASYGDDRYVDEVMDAVELLPEGQFTIDLQGPDGLVRRLRRLRASSRADRFETDACIAAAGQIVLEEVLLHGLRYLWEATKCPNLCFAGGVALNCAFNGTIVDRTEFDNVHVIFAPGDDGTAIGAAVESLLATDEPSATVRFPVGPYQGRSYPPPTGMDVSSAAALPPDKLYLRVAELLEAGKVVAWFEGRSEYGPRALGHRSILASPCDRRIASRLNRNIKFREWFRPFAPVVLEPDMRTFFEGSSASPWMQFAWPVRAGYRDTIAGVCHVDGTARVQTVKPGENTSLCLLLQAVSARGAPPVLLNTSFNVRGEPIVETPQQALDTFRRSEMDALVLEGTLVER